jgi:hypothetical protein
VKTNIKIGVRARFESHLLRAEKAIIVLVAFMIIMDIINILAIMLMMVIH